MEIFEERCEITHHACTADDQNCERFKQKITFSSRSVSQSVISRSRPRALSPLRPAGSPSGSAAPGLEHKYPKYSLGSRGAGATLKYRK